MELMTYDATQQHYGAWLSGYDWDVYGCGTYREPKSEVRAQILLKRFMEKLGRKVHAQVSYVAALERRYSGLGGCPLHWHFVAAGGPKGDIAAVGQELWWKHFGNAKIEPYDPGFDGAFYICKTAADAEGLLEMRNLDRLSYHGPSDLIESAHGNAYVPEHLKDKVFGQYLVVR